MMYPVHCQLLDTRSLVGQLEEMLVSQSQTVTCKHLYVFPFEIFNKLILSVLNSRECFICNNTTHARSIGFKNNEALYADLTIVFQIRYIKAIIKRCACELWRRYFINIGTTNLKQCICLYIYIIERLASRDTSCFIIYCTI